MPLQDKDEDAGGCILAHDMGLGKSLQVVAVLHTYHTYYPDKRSVLVVPPNVVHNWLDEFNAWLPDQASANMSELSRDKVQQPPHSNLRSVCGGANSVARLCVSKYVERLWCYGIIASRFALVSQLLSYTEPSQHKFVLATVHSCLTVDLVCTCTTNMYYQQPFQGASCKLNTPSDELNARMYMPLYMLGDVASNHHLFAGLHLQSS